LRGEVAAHLEGQLLAAPAVPHRDRDDALGGVLPDDMAVELLHDACGSKVSCIHKLVAQRSTRYSEHSPGTGTGVTPGGGHAAPSLCSRFRNRQVFAVEARSTTIEPIDFSVRKRRTSAAVRMV